MTKIPRVFPSAYDFESLSRIRTEISKNADSFDYATVVVNKPWGYEYLWYQNGSVAIWLLHLKNNCATSLHCHVRKRTSLIVIQGRVICSTIGDRFAMNVLDSVVLEPCVFHSTQAVSDDGAFVLEIESPPQKEDLIRLKDSFGRQGATYEGPEAHSSDFSKYNYQPFKGGPCKFCDLSFREYMLQQKNELLQLPAGLLIPVQGKLVSKTSVLLDIGESASLLQLDSNKIPEIFPSVQILNITNS